MTIPAEEPLQNAQGTREAEVAPEPRRLHADLPSAVEEERARPQPRPRPGKPSRRKLLTKGLGVAAVASVGAGTLLELCSGSASAASSKPGVFVSSVAGTPAVTASGTNGAVGVDASSDSGIGVTGTSTSGFGVTGSSGSGRAVLGISTSGVGVQGQSTSDVGVVGISDSASGVQGQSNSGEGVQGQSNINSGVVGVSGSGNGVLGITTSGAGVVGQGGSSFGVVGISDSGTGVYGQSSSGLAGQFEGDVQVHGNFSASGTKAFVQVHPTDPDQEIVYVALEGGEAGTYVRGSGQLQHGKAVLALPEHFALVTAPEDLTVQLTPRGAWLQIYVVELDPAQLVVREAQGKDGTFDYLIHGLRRGFEQHAVIRPKR